MGLITEERAGSIDIGAEGTEKFPFDGIEFDDTAFILKPPRFFQGGYKQVFKELSSSDSPYTIKPTETETDFLITTGASDFTLNWPSLSSSKYRRITVWKIDSGAGEIVNDGEGSETFNGLWTTCRVGLQWQHTTYMGMASTWMWLDGVKQPVALEPDIGGGWHKRITSDEAGGWLYSNSSISANTWYEIDFSSSVPSGTRLISCSFIALNASNVARVFWNSVNTASLSSLTPSLIIFGSESTTRDGGRYQLPINASRKGYVAMEDSNTDINVSYPGLYCL
jgi:hypothetical protein